MKRHPCPSPRAVTRVTHAKNSLRSPTSGSLGLPLDRCRANIAALSPSGPLSTRLSRRTSRRCFSKRDNEASKIPLFRRGRVSALSLLWQLSKGFARLHCPECGFERLVAFSCKGRLCPSCLARRTGEIAADLVDRVLWEVPYRQWVLTIPWDLRFLLATDPKFQADMLTLFTRTLFGWQRMQGRRLQDPQRPNRVGDLYSTFRRNRKHEPAILPDGLFVPDRDGLFTRCPLRPTAQSR